MVVEVLIPLLRNV